MRSLLYATAATLLSSGFLAAQTGTFTVYGKGCAGAGGTGCISANWTNPFNGNIGKRANFALAVNTGASARTICGIEMICKTRRNNSLYINVWIYDKAAAGTPGKILRTSTMPVTPTVRANRANFAALKLAKNTDFFIVLDNRADLNLPIMVTGTNNVHYHSGPPTWTGPSKSVPWNYNVICCGIGPIPVISSTGVPTIGQAFSIDLTKARPNAKALWIVGVKKTATDLTPIGAPSCTLLIEPLAVFGGLNTSTVGTLSIKQTLPNTASLVGFTFLTQFAVNDPANALQLVFSAGGEGKVGK